VRRERRRHPPAETVPNQNGRIDPEAVKGVQHVLRVRIGVPGGLPTRIPVPAQIDRGYRLPLRGKALAKIRKDAAVLRNAVNAHYVV